MTGDLSFPAPQPQLTGEKPLQRTGDPYWVCRISGTKVRKGMGEPILGPSWRVSGGAGGGVVGGVVVVHLLFQGMNE